MIVSFLSGGIMLGAAAISLFFFRSWRRARDRLFLLFAVAFALLAVERWALALFLDGHELRFSIYLIRLAAFVIIAAAIVDKNRSAHPADPPPPA